MSFSWENKVVLITGVTGFLGSHLGTILSDRKAKVIGVVHDLKTLSHLKLSGLDKKITICQGNILDTDRMHTIMTKYGVEYIFHCAADSIVQKCAKDPKGAFFTNIMGTVSVFEAARLSGGIMGAMSMESDKAYGSFDTKDLPYREDQAIKPKNVYEVSKACAGLVAHAYGHNYSLPVFTVRAANLYGPGDMNTTRLVPNSILRILNGESPILYSGVASYKREFLYVEDGAYAIVALMEKIKDTKSHVINIGSGETYRVKEVIEMITKMFKSSLTPTIVEKDPVFKEIEEQYLDLTKLTSFLPDFSPRTLKDGLKSTVDWYRTFYEKDMVS